MTGYSVYLIEHDDRWYDEGEMYVRGVYATLEDAEAGLAIAAGSPHDEFCCEITTWPVIETHAATA